MNSLLDTVEFLVAVGSDAGNQELVQPDSLLDSEGWLRQEDAAQMWESLDVDVSYLAPGIRALLRDAGTEAKLGICLLYFRMLNSAGCPVRHINCLHYIEKNGWAIRAAGERWCRLKTCLTSSASRCAGKRFVSVLHLRRQQLQALVRIPTVLRLVHHVKPQGRNGAGTAGKQQFRPLVLSPTAIF